MSTKVKVIMKFKHPLLAEILPKDFETELISILSTEDKVIVRGYNENGKMKDKPSWPATISPKGSFEGFTFKGANGLIYNDTFIRDFIGYVLIDKYFEKIPD